MFVYLGKNLERRQKCRGKASPRVFVIVKIRDGRPYTAAHPIDSVALGTGHSERRYTTGYAGPVGGAKRVPVYGYGTTRATTSFSGLYGVSNLPGENDIYFPSSRTGNSCVFNARLNLDFDKVFVDLAVFSRPTSVY